MLWRGMFAQALTVLETPADLPKDRESLIKVLAVESVAQARLHQFSAAEEKLDRARRMCENSPPAPCGDILRARGILAVQRGQTDIAKTLFAQSLEFARIHKDDFLAATALLNLGLTALRQEHFDEATDWTEAAYQAAQTLGASNVLQTALGNLGWAYYRLGDSDRSLELSLEAENLASQAGNIILQLTWIRSAGYVYADRGDLSRAKDSYRKALALATQIDGKDDIYDAYRALALVSLKGGELQEARRYSAAALAITRTDHNRLNELYPLLVEGLVAARSHDLTEAQSLLREVEGDHYVNASLKWRAQHGLARLYEDERKIKEAEQQYQSALATFEEARSTLHRNDARLPFAGNGSQIYDDYIHFLVAGGKSEEALRWAEYSRARTLAEGLQLLPPQTAAAPARLEAVAIARQAHGNVLFYWLGEKNSFLWVITPQKVTLLHLPPRDEIEAAAQRYHQALLGPQDPLQSSDRDGQWLYTTLVAPARPLLQSAKVFIIPDGSLNNLNFETLLVPEPTTHFWIEDVTLANASSLRLLAAASRSPHKPTHDRNLLLIGNSVAPNEKYPALAKAADQMVDVAKHFPADRKRVFTAAEATPVAYLSGSPGNFAYVHFVAHGIANRSNPLDSAIVLSRSNSQDDSFKLYARDILSQPLHAELVTISACYGAAGRTYTAEGLVGLSWAFLRAGSHHVVAALWEVADVSTERLMDQFYDELAAGASPDVALRNAKLSLLHGQYHSPFYWAPFQLYTGS